MSDLALRWLTLGFDVSLKALLLSLLAALALKVLRVRDSNIRHRVWAGVLAGMFLLPALAQLVPALRLPFIPAPDRLAALLLPPLPAETAGIDAEPSADDEPTPTEATQPAVDSALADAARPPEDDGVSLPREAHFGRGGGWGPMRNGRDRFARAPVGDFESDTLPVNQLPAAATSEPGDVPERVAAGSDVAAETSAPRERTAAVSLSRRLLARVPELLAAIWLAGVLWLTLRLVTGLLGAARLRRSATTIDPADLAAVGLEEVDRPPASRAAAQHRPIPLLECPLIRVPVTLGSLRPQILLPPEWIDWPADKLHAVLTHERTHVERADFAVALLAEINCALYWFHPLAWWVKAQLSNLAEEACDDAAIDQTGDRAGYARHLLEVAATASRGHGRVLAAGVSMARRSNVETRINSILDFTRPLSRRLTRGAALLLLAAIVPIIALAAALRPLEPQPELPAAAATTADEPGSSAEPAVEAPLKRDAAAGDQPATTTAQSGPSGRGAGDSRPVVPKPAAKGQSSIQNPKSEIQNPKTYSGHVADADGNPIAVARIFLAVHTATFDDAPSGALYDLGQADSRGDFTVQIAPELLAPLSHEHARGSPHLVARAANFGLDWLPLEAFDDRPAASQERTELQQLVDKALGAGRFAGRTLKLPPQERPIHGRLLDLEGHPLPGITIRVQDLKRPDPAALAKAFQQGSSNLVATANWETTYRRPGIERSVLQRLIPPATTDAQGAFTLEGIGRDQLATVVFAGDRVAGEQIHVLGRDMPPVRLPHIDGYPRGAKNIYAGRDFTHALGPSVPVVGIVRDHDSGEPIPETIVFVERLFGEGTGADEGQLRLDCQHLRAVTDKDGRFRITGVPPGIGHTLEAIPPRAEPFLMAAKNFSPRASDAEAFVEIRVKKTMWIEGQVTDRAAGEPLDAFVDYLALRKNPNTLDKQGLRQAWQMRRYRTDAQGRYRVPGLPGPGVVLALASGQKRYPLGAGAEAVDGYDPERKSLPTTPTGLPLGNWHVIRQIDPPLGAPSFTCDLVFSAGRSIRGRVVGPDGEAVSDFKAIGEVADSPFWSQHLDGTFTVQSFDAKAPRQLFFKSGDDRLAGQFRVAGDAPPQEIVVTLQPAVRVTGRLIDAATRDAAVGYELYSDKSSLGLYRISDIRTTEGGRFEIKGLLPGIVYELQPVHESRLRRDNEFRIDLSAARPGDAIDLGEVPGKTPSPPVRPVSEPEPRKAAIPAGAAAPGKEAGVARSTEPSASESSSIQNPKSKIENPPFTFAGTVVDEQGTPVAGANIKLEYGRVPAPPPDAPPLATTDAAGRFQLARKKDDFADADYERGYRFAVIIATKENYGFALKPALWLETTGQIDAEFSEEQKGLFPETYGEKSTVLTLVPDLPIRGRIVDIDGRPVGGAKVEPTCVAVAKAGTLDAWEAAAKASGPNYGTFREHLQTLAHPVYLSAQRAIVAAVAHTAADGTFVLKGIGRERIAEVFVSAPGIETQALLIRTRAGDPIKGARSTASTPPGDIRTVYPSEFTCVAAPGLAVEGRVTDSITGQPLAGASVASPNFRRTQLPTSNHLYSPIFTSWAPGMSYIHAETDADGRYRLEGLPRTAPRTVVARPVRGTPYFEASARIAAGKPSAVQDFALLRGVVVRGRVTEERTGEPVRGDLTYVAFESNPHVPPEEATPRFDRVGAFPDVSNWNAEDGRFMLVAVPGKGILGFRAYAWQDYGRQRIAEQIVAEPADQMPDGTFKTIPSYPNLLDRQVFVPLDIAADAAEVTVDLKPVRGASVFVRLLAPDGGALRGAYVHDTGYGVYSRWLKNADERFEVRGYFPERSRRLMFSDPERNLAGYYDLAGPPPEHLEITLRPAATLVGRVVDGDGAAVADAVIENPRSLDSNARADPALGHLQASQRTDAQGRFEFKGLVPGLRYSATVTGSVADQPRSRLSTSFTDVTLESGELKDLGDLRALPPRR